MYKGYCRKILPATLIFILTVLDAGAQPDQADLKTQQLLMQLGAGYLNVARQNQIDLDSGLLLAGRRNHISRMHVIGEYDEDIDSDVQKKWWVAEDLPAIKLEALSSKGTRQTTLLNLIAAFYVFQPAARAKDLDSARIYLTLAKKSAEMDGNITSRCRTLSYLGKYYLESGDIPAANKVFTEAIDQAGKSGLQAEKAMALTYQAVYSPFQPHTIAERIGKLQKALAIYEQLNDDQRRIILLTDIGYLNFAMGKVQEAKKSFLAALEIQKRIGFPYTHYTTDLLGLISPASGNHEEQLYYAMDEIRTVEATLDSVAIPYFYARRAEADLDYNPEDEFSWHEKALNEFIRLGGDPAMYAELNLFARGLIKRGREKEAIRRVQEIFNKYPPVSPIDRQNAWFTLANAYIAANDNAGAIRYLKAAEEIQKETEKIRGNISAFNTYFQLGDFYYDLRQYDKSQQAYMKAQTYGQEKNNLFSYEWMNLRLARIDSIHGDFEKGFNHLSLYNRLRDSSWTKNSTKVVSEMREKYEADLKDNNIKILNQQAQLQEAEIKQGRFTRNIVIAGSLLLFMFLGYLYYQFRLKQKSNQQLGRLVIEKQFLLKEIHHRVKNNLQIVISLLNTQSKFLDSAEAIAAISESRHRMQAMSLIHQRLYQSDDVAFVGMQAYIRDLISYLDSIYNVNNRIHIERDVDPLDMDISQAIPIGLILNEAITNSFKHAFTDQHAGTIRVKMKSVELQQIHFEIADNGMGMDLDQHSSFSQSMGMRLIRGLSKQIGGKLITSNDNGLVISISFKQNLVLRSVTV